MCPTVEATGIYSQTCVGVIGGQYPLPVGNCFSVLCAGHTLCISIVNFCLENLQELLRRGVVAWPIAVHVMDADRGIGVIHDARIPHAWYSDRYCEICCPRDLWPLPQRLAFERDIATGRVREIGTGGRVVWYVDPSAE